MGKMKKSRPGRGLPKVSLEEQLTSDKLPKQRNREPKIKFRFEEDEKVSGCGCLYHFHYNLSKII